MLSLSTITHGKAPRVIGVRSGVRRATARRLEGIAVILIIGMALGYAVSTVDFTTESSRPAVAAMSHEEFLTLNTTELNWLLPTAAEAAVASIPAPARVAEVDPFTWVNVGSYAALNQPWELGAFLEANVASYDGLIRIFEERHAVDPTFLAINTQLPSTYVEPAAGPR